MEEWGFPRMHPVGDEVVESDEDEPDRYQLTNVNSDRTCPPSDGGKMWKKG